MKFIASKFETFYRDIDHPTRRHSRCDGQSYHGNGTHTHDNLCEKTNDLKNMDLCMIHLIEHMLPKDMLFIGVYLLVLLL